MCSSLRSIVESGRGRNRVPSAWSPLSSRRPTTQQLLMKTHFHPRDILTFKPATARKWRVVFGVSSTIHIPYPLSLSPARTRHVCDLCTRTQTHTHTHTHTQLMRVPTRVHAMLYYTAIHAFIRHASFCSGRRGRRTG